MCKARLYIVFLARCSHRHCLRSGSLVCPVALVPLVMLMLVAGFVLPLLRSQLSLELAEALHLVASVLHMHSPTVQLAFSCDLPSSQTTRMQYDRHLCFPCWQLQNSRRDWSISLPYLKLMMAACLCYTLVLSPDTSFCKINLVDRSLDESSRWESTLL